MNLSFVAERDPDVDRIRELSMLEPTNPFYTPQYAEFRRQQGEQVVLLLLLEEDRIVRGCTGFITRGRLNKLLDIPSRPGLVAEPNGGACEVFWNGVRVFCSSEGITSAAICSFAAAPGPIPPLAKETMRTRRREFVIDLIPGQPLTRMRKGHAYDINRGRRAGLIVLRNRDEMACVSHVELMNASMQRRRGRGETAGFVEQTANHRALLASGAAELFQAALGGEVLSSNMILLAPVGGYNHTQGTSPAGMACGAAHFLIAEVAASLAAEGRTTFNLGGTDQIGTGLERFKSGFSRTTLCVELEAARFQMRGSIATAWLAAKRLAKRSS